MLNLSFDEYSKYFQACSLDTFCRYPKKGSLAKSNELRTILFFINRITLKLLRKLKFFQSPFHCIVIADLPEYQFGEDKYYELNSPTFQSLARRKPFVFLFGRFFRDYTNFEKYKDVIRDYFRPAIEIQDKVDKLLSSARKDSDFVIGVHIRRGDYEQFAGGRYFYSPVQYAQKLEALQTEIAPKRINFIICSNEIITGSVFKNVNFIIGSGHIVGDMYALSQCDFILGPPSTFSLWAAFYGNKPLCQIKDMSKQVTMEDFVFLPPEILYNF